MISAYALVTIIFDDILKVFLLKKFSMNEGFFFVIKSLEVIRCIFPFSSTFYRQALKKYQKTYTSYIGCVGFNI